MRQLIGMLSAIALTALCWGLYGQVLHLGKAGMGSGLRQFVCVGVAYFLIAVLAPLALLTRGEQGAWSAKGVFWSLLAGAAGAFGALGVILALSLGGNPIYVMPLVFGGAPVVNTLLTAAMNRSFGQLRAPFLAGLILVIVGAVTVLVFKPRPQAHATASDGGVAERASEPGALPPPDGQPSGAAAAHDPAATGAGTVAAVGGRAERLFEVLLATALAMASWGAYGPVLHRGQSAMAGSRLRPLVCIGVAYFLIAVAVPLALLGPLEDAGRWDVVGGVWSLAGGALGAIGALGTILAFACGGRPFTVMPVVFGCAPVINTLAGIAIERRPLSDLSPVFLAGLIVVAVGAATVLAFGPRGHAPAKPA